MIREGDAGADDCPSGVAVLWERHAGDILLYLREAETNGRAVKESELRREVTCNSQRTVDSRLWELRSAGLVDVVVPDPSSKGHKARVWVLTEKGRAVAVTLTVLNRMILSEGPAAERIGTALLDSFGGFDETPASLIRARESL